jgi:hypothetical protein
MQSVIFPTKNGNRILLFGSTLKHGLYFDYWNQLLSTHMRICYLDFHEVALCCYLVIHIERLLRSLQLFYVNLWPIYWIPLVSVCNWSCKSLSLKPLPSNWWCFLSVQTILSLSQESHSHVHRVRHNRLLVQYHSCPIWPPLLLLALTCSLRFPLQLLSVNQPYSLLTFRVSHRNFFLA